MVDAARSRLMRGRRGLSGRPRKLRDWTVFDYYSRLSGIFPEAVSARHADARAARRFRQERDSLMANIASARKRARQAVQRNLHNSSLRSRLRTAIKSVRKAILAGDKDAAKRTLQSAQGVIDRIADKKIVHKNAASRYKSRLAAAIKSMS